VGSEGREWSAAKRVSAGLDVTLAVVQSVCGNGCGNVEPSNRGPQPVVSAPNRLLRRLMIDAVPRRRPEITLTYGAGDLTSTGAARTGSARHQAPPQPWAPRRRRFDARKEKRLDRAFPCSAPFALG
jgi:hypothetical protein